MPLRIHFGPGDLARVRLARRADPSWELLLSLFQLQSRPVAGLSAWQRRTATAVRAPALRTPVRLLTQLCRPGGYVPDFLNPDAPDAGVDEQIDAVLHTPRTTLRKDLGFFATERGRVPEWAQRVGSGEPAALRELGSALRRYYNAAVEPVAADIATAVAQDRRLRTAALSDGGIDALFATFDPAFLRWRHPVLTVRGTDHDVYLRGRGLLLVPSYFCRDRARTLGDENRTPTLVYPAHWPPAQASSPDLAALMGGTRARILRTVLDAPATTTQLASELGLAPSTVSEHVGVLRSARLLSSGRIGNCVHHAATDRAMQLAD